MVQILQLQQSERLCVRSCVSRGPANATFPKIAGECEGARLTCARSCSLGRRCCETVFTCVEQDDGLHAQEFLAGDLKVGKLLRDELDGEAQVVNGGSLHLFPDEEGEVQSEK